MNIKFIIQLFTELTFTKLWYNPFFPLNRKLRSGFLKILGCLSSSVTLLMSESEQLIKNTNICILNKYTFKIVYHERMINLIRMLVIPGSPSSNPYDFGPRVSRILDDGIKSNCRTGVVKSSDVSWHLNALSHSALIKNTSLILLLLLLYLNACIIKTQQELIIIIRMSQEDIQAIAVF